MHLESISLRDWKAFEAATFEFPAPSKTKNVIVIGGRNGFGKTSLFEALVLGLFGRDGLRLVQRAGIASDEPGRAQSFKDFMERALFGNALAKGRNSCRIELKFIDDAGEPIWIDRTWYFTDYGKLRSGESAEQLKVFQGIGRRVVGPSRTESDVEGWYRDWISKTFIPTSLAGFFLFDGESAAIYAERDMASQVREGIEGLLGLNWLKQLQKDLRAYANAKRSQVPKGVSNEAIAELEAAVSAMEQELESCDQRLRQVEQELADAELLRDSLTRELGYGAGTKAQLEQHIRDQADQEKLYNAAQDRLNAAAQADLPLALAGRQLLTRVESRLEQEARLDQWEAALSQRDGRTSRVLEFLDQQLPTVEPALMERQVEGVRAAVESALERLWFPPPGDVADSFRHSHARGPMLQRVLDRLRDARELSSTSIVQLLETMESSSAKLREIAAAIRSSEGSSPQIEEKRDQLNEINGKVGLMREERGSLINVTKSRSADLEQKRKELARLTGHLDQSQKPAQLAARAEQVAEMLGNLLEEAWPLQSEAVAEEMSQGIQAMAHRNDYLQEVRINDEGDVELSSPDGRDLRQYDLSAGEKQIFTQALFSAIAEVSQKSFPLVIDTPLGRLDEDHRLNVLKHITNRRGQVILISTDTEVVGQYLEAVRSKVGKFYVIRNKVEGGIARSWSEEGYFQGQEV